MIHVEYIVNSVFTSRTYILTTENSEYVWLVDCGDFDKVLELIGWRKITGVLLTHSHFDHIYGLNELIKEYPKAAIYTNDFGYEALVHPKLNISKYHTEYEDFMLSGRSGVRILSEGSDLELFGQKVDVYETPGHDPSCLTYRVDNIVFTGDSYIPGVKTIASFPNSNKTKAIESKKKIVTIADGCIVYSGHELI